jgi:hypothetical protein
MEPTDGGSMAAPDASRALDGGEADAAVIAFAGASASDGSTAAPCSTAAR